MLINRYIDSTLLKPVTQDDIRALCNDAILYDFCAVCVQPHYVALCKQLLKDTNVKVATVVGFPLGANNTKTKIFEAELAVKEGADEIDMVVNHNDFLNGHYSQIINEINAIKETANVTVKVIIETSILSKEQITKMCELVNYSKADFIKTSTGFVGDGAKLADVELMASLMQNGKYVKASGGIRSLKDAEMFINVGAKRLGTSSGVKIMQEMAEYNK